MRGWKWVGATLGMVLFMAAPASAEWLYQQSEDPFNGDLSTAYVASPGEEYGFGFRCRMDDEAEVIYLTPELISQADVSALVKVDLRLLVIIDDEPRVQLRARADVTDNGTRLGFVSEDVAVESVLRRLMTAKRRLAVGVEIEKSEVIHTKVLDVERSSETLSRLLQACGIPPSG